MDPLSITASAVAVIQAAGFTTTTIFNFVQSIRSADSRIASLCDELSGLQNHLDAVQRTLEECRTRELAPVHTELWQRCDEALKDCLVTLSLLEALVNKIKDAASSKGKGLIWRTKVVVDMSIHGDELVAFREKIQKSSIALQTMLHTITLSLSLKSNASQDRILFELEQLKYSFKEALRLSLRPTGGRNLYQGDNADARVSQNLHKLAAAARQFHSAASSTSGTTRDGSNVSWRALSLIGDFPEHKQQRVRDFIEHQLHYPAPVSVASGQDAQARATSPRPSHFTTTGPLATSPAALNISTVLEPTQVDSDEDDEDDETDETDDEQEYFDGLEELARDRMLSGDYAKAIDFLTQAMARDIGATSTGHEFRELQILLALCHFFQGDWKKAEPIVTSLSRVLDEVTCNLLHALALSHLFEYSLDSALKTCRKSMNGKKKLLMASPAGCDGYPGSDYAETVALFATIHHVSGDPIRAEIFHRRLPENFEYKHPASAVDFIREHPRVLPIVLGSDVPVSSAGIFGWPDDAPRFFPAPTTEHSAGGLCRNATVAESPLRLRFAFFERYENDTLKVVVEGPSPCSPTDSGIDMDADDESSPTEASSEGETPLNAPAAAPPLLEPTPPLRLVPKRGLTRIFTSRQRRNHAADDDPGADVAQSTDTPALPASRWNKFGFTKSKRLLRKKSNDSAPENEPPSTVKRTRTLRVGAMELTLRTRALPVQNQDMPRLESEALLSNAGEDNTATSCDWRFDPSAEPLQDSRTAADVSLDHSGQGIDSDSLSCSSVEAPRRRPGSNAHVEPHITDQPDPTVGSFSTCSTSGGSVVSSSPRSAQESARPQCELPVTEKPVELHGVALSPIEIIDKYISDQWESFRGWSPYGEPTPSTAGISGVSGKSGRLSDISEESTEAQDYAARPLVIAVPSRSCTATTDLAGLLDQVAGVLATLPDAADADKRLAARSELETILGLLDGISNDPVLACDLRRIIASLDAGRGSSADDASDSGYETGDQQPLSDSPERPTPAASPSNSDSGAPFHARLRPTPSFVTGDDEKFTRRGLEVLGDDDERGCGAGMGGAGPAALDRRVLLALRPYARPRGGGGAAAAPGLRRTFSFAAGVDDHLYLSGERPAGEQSPSGSDENDGDAGSGLEEEEEEEEEEEAVVLVDPVAKKQVVWALEPELPISSDSLGEGERSVKRSRVGLSNMRMLAKRFSVRIRGSLW